MFLVLLLYAISASTFIISKSLLVYSTPLFLSGIRTLIAGSIFLFYLKMRGQTTNLKKYLMPCLTIGFFSFFVSNTLKFWSLHYLSSERAALIAISEPFFAMIFAYLLCSEKMNAQRWFGLVLCIGGAFIGVTTHAALPLGFALPEIVLLLSVIASSYGALLMRTLVITHQYSPTIINCISMTGAGFLSLSSAFSLEQPLELLAPAPIGYFILLLGMMIFISNIFAYSLYGKIINMYSAVLISCASLLRPFFIALYSRNITAQTLISTIIICVGLWVLYRQPSTSENGVSCFVD